MRARVFLALFVLAPWLAFVCYVSFEVLRGVLFAPGPFPVFLPPRG